MDGKKGRIPVSPVVNRITHEHDLSLHPEHEGAAYQKMTSVRAVELQDDVQSGLSRYLSKRIE